MKSFDKNIREMLEEGASAQSIKGFSRFYYLEDIDLPEVEVKEPGAILQERSPDLFDTNICAKVLVPMGGELQEGVAAKDRNGTVKYPTQDTRIAKVDFGNGLKDPNGLLDEITG
jgi:hypothetical protein